MLIPRSLRCIRYHEVCLNVLQNVMILRRCEDTTMYRLVYIWRRMGDDFITDHDFERDSHKMISTLAKFLFALTTVLACKLLAPGVLECDDDDVAEVRYLDLDEVHEIR